MTQMIADCPPTSSEDETGRTHLRKMRPSLFVYSSRPATRPERKDYEEITR